MASLDNLFVVVTVFIVAIGFLVMLGVWGLITTPAFDNALWDDNPTSQAIKESGQTTYDNADMYFVIGFFGVHLAILLVAFSLRTHPIIYVAGLFLIVVLMLLSAPLSNVYADLAGSDEYTMASASLPKTTFLMQNLPLIEMVFGFITIIVLAGLARSEGFL